VYKCANHDNREDGLGACNAHDVQYEYALSLGVGGIQMDCVNGNGHDTCEARACCCDAGFIMKLINFDFAGKYDANLKHHDDNENVVFDYSGVCGAGEPNGETIEHKTACCGDYPERAPYNEAHMMCCANTNVFNPAHLECCDDGSVIALGNTCAADATTN
jgi:hypothetical protein